MVKNVNIQTRFRVDEEAWPPEPPKTFTPLLLLRCPQNRNLKQSIAVAEFLVRGHVDKVATPKQIELLDNQPLQETLQSSRVTKEVTEILDVLERSDDPQFILLEGAPGIGKTFLLKETAYRWGKQKALHKFKLVLFVSLRSPAVQGVSQVDKLLQLFCGRISKSAEISTACDDYLSDNSGEDVVFLLDGYDEYPEELRRDSLIADILKRKVLPCCGLIVSSRPHALEKLRELATVKIDILGFTTADRQQYIIESMKDQPQKIDELTQYLQRHVIINNLCFVPFNITVFVYLYKQGISLPKTSTELYHYFICLTISRHLAKNGRCLQNDITELTDLPDPYKKIIQQLSKFSLEALNDDKLIFTDKDIKAGCPDIIDIPEAGNGFGLLQAVKHFGLTTTTTTYNFLHFSIQEYLAAHYIANLPDDEVLKILEEKFESSIHANMFSIYITLTGGQQPAFKHFLSGGNETTTICDKFLKNELLCLRLYSSFLKAGNVDMCKVIEQSKTFKDKGIDLTYRDGRRLGSDVECIGVILTSSYHKQWANVLMYGCYIADQGLSILHHEILHCNDITIGSLCVGYNGLTEASSSMLTEIVRKCQVKILGLLGNGGIVNQQLYPMLQNPSSIVSLNLYDTHLSSTQAIALFNVIKDNTTLKDLCIDYNDITDDACDAIITSLQKNSCLLELTMADNPLSCKGMGKIIGVLKVNNTLQCLRFPKFVPGFSREPEDIGYILCSIQEVSEEREYQGLQVISFFTQRKEGEKSTLWKPIALIGPFVGTIEDTHS